jgi:hypothetical protein
MRSERSESDTAVANDADRYLPQELDHEVAGAADPQVRYDGTPGPPSTGSRSQPWVRRSQRGGRNRCTGAPAVRVTGALRTETWGACAAGTGSNSQPMWAPGVKRDLAVPRSLTRGATLVFAVRYCDTDPMTQ